MQPSDKAYLWDMITASEDIMSFIDGITVHEFSQDKKTRFAIERQLLVLGEAAKHVSEETKNEFSEIAWRKIIGLRNIIAHEYGDVIIERIWNICKKNIPELLAQLQKTELK